jgi:hypothetical protein
MTGIEKGYESPDEGDFVAPGARPTPEPVPDYAGFEEEINASREPGPDVITNEQGRAPQGGQPATALGPQFSPADRPVWVPGLPHPVRYKNLTPEQLAAFSPEWLRPPREQGR